MIRIKSKYFIVISLISTLLLCSCNNSKRKADIGDININIKVERFDKAFWTIDTNNIKSSFTDLSIEYPEMSRIYLQNVLNFGHPDSSITHQTYKIFRRQASVDTIYTDALKKYDNMENIEKELSLAFRRGKYFFPEIPTPKIYSHISGFNQSLVIGSDFISISLDNYMGEDYPVYAKVGGIHKYQRANMKPEKVVSDYLTGWISSEFQIGISKRILLDEMIYRGKIMYVISCLLPNEDEHIIMGYSPEQWQWSIDHEAYMWSTLIANNDLFSDDYIKNGAYLNDGPFTIHFSQASPARGGIFLGWRIVNEYMKNNPNISPLDLMITKDPNEILQASGYNPR